MANRTDIESYPVIHPGTGLEVHRVAAATTQDVDDAIASCHAAWKSWSRRSIKERRAVAFRAVHLLRDPGTGWSQRLRKANLKETDISAFWAQAQVDGAADAIEEIACSMQEALKGEYIALSDSHAVLVSRESMGVCLAIPAWNAVHSLTLRAILTPIMAGNTVVLKTSEITPHSQLLWATLLQECGLPSGVLEVVHISTDSAPQRIAQLVTDQRVKHVNFTGSTRVGSIIASLAGKHLKPTLMELGGKAPVVILPDADMVKAANAVLFGTMMNAGQICMSTERVIIPRSGYLTLVSALQDAWNSYSTSKSTDEAANGLFSVDSAQRVRRLVCDALGAGAVDVLGTFCEEQANAIGNGVPACIVGQVTKDMAIYSEETFGPVCAVIVVEDDLFPGDLLLDELVRIANDSVYGLSAAVWSKDLALAMNVAQRIRSGAVHINAPTPADPPQIPHGGMNQSGWGRFNGVEGLRGFTQASSFLRLSPITVKS